MKNRYIIWFFFIIKTLFVFSEDINNNYICPIDAPLLNLSSSECVYANYNGDDLKISNKIIETQWLNRMNQIGDINIWYMVSDFSSYGDLIVQSFIYLENRAFPERYFYGIKSNGRPLFYDKENHKFINEITLSSSSIYPKFESELIRIKIINDDNDYYICPSFSNYTIEIIDLKNNQIKGIYQSKLFEYAKWDSLIYSILDLKNEEKTYLFCFIGKIGENSYLSLQKFQFLSADISQTNSYIKKSFSLENENYLIRSSMTITCFEITKYNIIQCFYLNFTGNYTIGLFKEDNLEFINSTIIDRVPEGFESTETVELFYQSINLKNEISVLAYMLNKNPDCIYIQMKNVIYDKYLQKYDIEDFLLKYQKFELKIENQFFNSFLYLSHLKKINPNKYSLISSRKETFTWKIYELSKHQINFFYEYISLL